MTSGAKTAQLQIRVSAAEKAAIQRLADRAGQDMSAYVLARLLPAVTRQFQSCIGTCARSDHWRFGLASLNSLLSRWSSAEIEEAVALAPQRLLTPIPLNYVVAMVEQACVQHGLAVPAWVHRVEPLPEPEFGSALQGLRLHLLSRSPPPFRRRNLFVDSTLGAQV